MVNKETYILGADTAELHRLGLQHQVWAREAHKGWNRAGYTEGQTILDMGCGPGFCTTELAYRVGAKGKIIGVDFSKPYIAFAKAMSKLHGLNTDLYQIDLHKFKPQQNSLDGVFCRWVLAWVENAELILDNILPALKSGGTFMAHEYYAWEFFRFEPYRKNLQAGLDAAFHSFEESPGFINIGARLPALLRQKDLEVISIRPMPLLCTPRDLSWIWPKSFLSSYFLKLADLGYLKKHVAGAAVKELLDLEHIPGATCFCPPVIEVIARKP